jgi:hypothetical protein
MTAVGIHHRRTGFRQDHGAVNSAEVPLEQRVGKGALRGVAAAQLRLVVHRRRSF